jgi:hypothetical protein
MKRRTCRSAQGLQRAIAIELEANRKQHNDAWHGDAELIERLRLSLPLTVILPSG